MKRAHLFLVPFVFGLVGAEDDARVDPDAQAFLMSISMGRGLYYNFPYIVNLNATNFDSMVKGKDFSWFIEFYNSWCGHCLRFTPTYKRFAADLKGWSPVVKIGAVDCSNELNTPLCRDYEILSYPTLKYFPPKFPDEFYGSDVPKRTVEDLREAVVSELVNRTDLQGLTPVVGSLANLWASAQPGVQNLVLVVECAHNVGPELVLDYWSVKDVFVVPTPCTNADLMRDLSITLPSSAIYLLQRNAPPKPILTGEFDRAQALAALQTHFSSTGIAVPAPFNLSSIKEVKIDLNEAFAWAQKSSDIKNKIRNKQHTDEVYQVDIEGALRRTLTVEIPMHKHINGTSFEALYNYLTVLNKYFPFLSNGKNFLQCVMHGLSSRNAFTGISGSEFSDAVGLCTVRFHPVYLDPDGGWLGCRGTLPTFRGYPCAMWTMFHTLTVQAKIKGASDPQEVLKAMVGYIGNFFGCSDCAGHFIKMAATMPTNMSSNDDSILWLWNAHNSANRRLHGDPTEDPNFPKVQFPTSSICPNCYLPNGLFDEKGVLQFLTRMYSSLSYIVPADVKTEGTAAEETASERTEHGIKNSNLLKQEHVVDHPEPVQNRTLSAKLWDITLFDVSLCVILYVISMGIIVLVCIKFLKNRRSYRKKPYYNDIF